MPNGARPVAAYSVGRMIATSMFGSRFMTMAAMANMVIMRNRRICTVNVSVTGISHIIRGMATATSHLRASFLLMEKEFIFASPSILSRPSQPSRPIACQYTRARQNTAKLSIDRSAKALV